MIPGEPQAHLVDTPADVDRFNAWLTSRLDANVPLALDSETTGLEWWTPSFTRLVTISDDNEGYAIPTEWHGRLIHYSLRQIADASNPIIFQNAKFDQHAFATMGWSIVPWHRVEDTKLLLHLRRSDLSSSLKGPQTADLLGKWIYNGQSELRKFMNTHKHVWASIPVDTPQYWVYGVLDTIITRRLWDALAGIRAAFLTAYDRERAYQAVMFEVEQRGILLDSTYTKNLSEDLAKQAEQELTFLRANGLANPNSQQQLVALLEEDFGWVPTTFTDTGQPATDKHVLAMLAETGGLQAEVVESLIKYKRALKFKVSYADQFLARKDRLGRVHPDINTLGAKTGRSSVRNPALQTLPSGDPLIRRCLKADPGFAWYSLDFSNQEPRALAHYGQSAELTRYFTQGDGQGSIHDFVAAELFGPGYTKAERSIAKAFGLGRSYGAGVATLAVASGLQESEVRAVLPKYDQLMGLEALNKAIEKNCAGRDPAPFVVTHGGRRVFAHPDKLYTLVNFLMQGSGADMTKDAAIRLDEHGYGDNILLPVHDEICFEIPRDEPDMIRDIAKVMQDDTYAVPMPTDVSGPGNSWGDLYD